MIHGRAHTKSRIKRPLLSPTAATIPSPTCGDTTVPHVRRTVIAASRLTVIAGLTRNLNASRKIAGQARNDEPGQFLILNSTIGKIARQARGGRMTLNPDYSSR